MRLIDADYVQRKAANTFNVNRATLGEESMLWRFQQIVDEAPTEQAEPVVRCKDCKWYNTNGCDDGFGWCEKNGDGHGSTDDWFCADGEQEEADA